MCLAIPGQILEIKDGTATIDYWVEKRTAKVMTDDYKKDDYVIVQGGFVVMKISEKEAKESLEAYSKLKA
jgi:hydrogenase assembly chaperone HypC/HupF